jgi:hypothetical protein
LKISKKKKEKKKASTWVEFQIVLCFKGEKKKKIVKEN